MLNFKLVVKMSEIPKIFFDPEFRKIMEEYGDTGSGEKLLKFIKEKKESGEHNKLLEK